MKLVSTFLDGVKRNGYIPANCPDSVTTDLLNFTIEEMQETIWPELIRFGEEYLLVSEYFPIKNSSGQTNYPNNIIPIPSRAFARTIREVKLINTEDLENGTVDYKQNVPWINLEDETYYNDYALRGREDVYQTSEFGCFLISDGIKFTKDFYDSNKTVEIRYVSQPPSIESSSTLNGDINQLTYDSINDLVVFGIDSVGTDLNTFCADTATTVFDIYRKSSGALLFANVTLTRDGTDFSTANLSSSDMVTLASFQEGGFNGTSNTLTTGYSSELMIVPAKRTNYIPLHSSFINLLQIAVTIRYLRSTGDTEMLSREEARYNDVLRKLRDVHKDRFRGEPKRIFPNRGFLNSIGRRGRWGSR